jgi:hypothetical protein
MIFRIIVPLLMAIFYTCYFSKMIIQKKKGIKISQIGSARPDLLKVLSVR